MSTLNPQFIDLTWDDLNAWAGAAVCKRGKSYRSHVEDPRLLQDGGLLGWVYGTEKYATQAWVDDSGQLRSRCTCPYGERCKHAVALILTVLDSLKSKLTIPAAPAGDPRLRLLRQTAVVLDEDDENWENEDEHWEDDEERDGEDWEDEEEEEEVAWEDEEPSSPRRRRQAKASGAYASLKPNEERILRQYYQGLSKEKLVELMLEQADRHPELRRDILDREALRGGKVSKIVRDLRGEITELAGEPGWSRHWSHESYTPDYSHVRHQLKNLLEAGHADEVLELGEELWEAGQSQVEQSDDEGETANQIGECMTVVWQALCASTSLKPPEKLLRVLDTNLEDGYSILGEEWGALKELHLTRADWSKVADIMAGRLKQASSEDKYGRQQLMYSLIDALEQAGREAEVLPLLEREAPQTDSYETLVDCLLKAGRTDEARRWAIEGYRKTIEKLPGIAWQLESQLRGMDADAGNLPAVAAWRALEFFYQPALESFLELQRAAEVAGAGPAVRQAALAYLEKGTLPGPEPVTRTSTAEKKPGRHKRVETKGEGGRKNSEAWPLPELEVGWRKPQWGVQWPMKDVLIDLALHERRHDDAIALLGDIKKWGSSSGGGWDLGRDEKVAQAVQESHPDVALQIWRQRAETTIKNSSGNYEEAARYLRLMQPVYERTGRMVEWQALLMDLRQRYKPRRNLLKVLDTLEGKGEGPRRIIDTR